MCWNNSYKSLILNNDKAEKIVQGNVRIKFQKKYGRHNRPKIYAQKVLLKISAHILSRRR